jgi:YggT family protein
MLNPFIDLLSNIIYLINLIVIAWLVLSLLVHFDIVNRHQPLVTRLLDALNRLVNPLLRPIRRYTTRYLPDLGGIDLSPLVLLLLLHFINSALYHWFYTI